MMDGQDLDAAWNAVRKRLRLELGDNTFKSWIQPLVILDLTSAGDLFIGAPTAFMRDRIRSHFLDRLGAVWRNEYAVVQRVELIVAGAAQPVVQTDSDPVVVLPSVADVAGIKPARAPKSTPASVAFGLAHTSAAGPVAEAIKTPQPAAETPVVMPFPTAARSENGGVGAPLDRRYLFENFVVGKSNELAYAAARRVAEDPLVKFNPLFLYGGVGLGKTHLMHAIAWAIHERSPTRRVLYLSAEKFMFQFVKAIRHNDQMAFKEQFRSVDVLMIDDVQFISGKNSTQEEFFHTFNALVDHNRQIVISADRSPTDLDGIEERIKSRLGWGLAADIHQTDYELRLGILQSKLEKLGKLDLSPKVMEFLAYRITSNVRELEGALNRVVAFADLTGRQATIEMAQEVLQDLLRANDRRVTIEDIQKRVAEYYNLRLEELLSQRRARQFARPRQIAMYLAKQLTTRSLPEIGKRFGGRDHTTVIHAVRKIEELCACDAVLLEQVDSLRRMLES